MKKETGLLAIYSRPKWKESLSSFSQKLIKQLEIVALFRKKHLFQICTQYLKKILFNIACLDLPTCIIISMVHSN